MRSAFDIVSACASVLATTKSTPCSPAVIMLLTALPPAPPTPNTVIRGFSSLMSGGVRLSAMVASRLRARWFSFPGRRPRELVEVEWAGKDSSEALAKPSSDLSEIAVSPCPELPRMPRFDVFKMSVLRIDEQTRGSRERRALRLTGQPAEPERTADAHRPSENLSREFANAGKLRGATAQHNSRPRLCSKGGIREPVPDHFKNLLGAVPDDVRDRGAGHDLRNIPLV